MKLNDCEIGERVAQLLAGAWRDHAQLPKVSEDELTVIAQRFSQTGTSALGWWRVCNTPLANTVAGQQLHDVYRRFRLSALIHEQEICDVISCLRAANIEPVLVKGWAIARKYPDPGLRPYGDIDLCVRPDQFADAEAALKCFASLDSHYVDLHAGFDYIGCGENASIKAARDLISPPAGRGIRGEAARRNPSPHPSPKGRGSTKQSGVALRLRPHSEDWNEFFARSQLVTLRDVQVRILSDEDHLRILCQHFFRSGAWRPLGLCDIAIAIETARPDFDWNVCLGSNPVYANWVQCAVGLAQELLGAEVRTACGNGRALPAWLAPAVLRQWGRERDPNERATKVPEMLTSTRASGKVFQELYARWENPVRATARVGGRFNNWPRWPYQIGELLLRAPELLRP